ncbi:MAG: glycosyltransferase [Saprospiraceae bacterium]|nr:glycosyltransferase [Saprospiraceae bacterium]
MEILLVIAWAVLNAIIGIAYLRVVLRYRADWRKLPDWSLPIDFSPKTKISVIVPARNEAAKLPDCLASIAQQGYPSGLFEVVVIDDASEDGTAAMATDFAEQYANFKTISLVKNGGSSPFPALPYGKKAAIEMGIAAACGELIVCTDADCMVPKNWLLHLAAFYETTGAKFIAAPVAFHHEKGGLQRFQSLDFLGMMGVTGAGFQSGSGLLCNGANLAYPKAIFEEVGGFEGIDGLASGDDMLLLHKVAKRYPNEVFFLKNKAATVLTEAQPNLRSFLSQRLRWASKSRSYEDRQVTFRLGVVFLLCWAICLNAALAIWLGWPLLALSFGLLLMKSATDFVFLQEMATYFQRGDLMRQYWRSQLVHIAYIIVVGTWANFAKRYEWKGRRVR